MSKELTNAQIIRKAGRLLLDRKRRTRGAYARKGNNRHCDTTDNKACRFCLTGAIGRVVNTDDPGSFLRPSIWDQDEQQRRGIRPTIMDLLRDKAGVSVVNDTGSVKSLESIWDEASTTVQDRIAKAMAYYKE